MFQTEDEPAPGTVLTRARWLLAYFSVFEMIMFMDRALPNAMMSQIREKYHISSTLGEMLNYGFILGFILGCIPVGIKSKKTDPIDIFCVGAFIFMVANCIAFIEGPFWVLVLSRLLAGIGQACICTLGFVIVNDLSPVDSKTLWLSIFAMMIPLGYCLGLSTADYLIHATNSIHWPYMIQTIAVFFLLLPMDYPIIRSEMKSTRVYRLLDTYRRASNIITDNRGSIELGQDVLFNLNGDLTDSLVRQSVTYSSTGVSRIDAQSPESSTLKDDLSHLITNRVFMFLSLGFAAFTFTFAGLFFWSPTYIEDTLGQKNGITILCVVAITSGIIGSLMGGIVEDYILKTDYQSPSKEMRCEVSTRISFIIIMIATVFLAISLILPHFFLFLFGLSLALMAYFGSLGPLYSALFGCVSDYYRGVAICFAAIIQHLLGDLLAPSLISVFRHMVGLRFAMFLLVIWLGWTVSAWFFALVYIRKYNRRTRVGRA